MPEVVEDTSAAADSDCMSERAGDVFLRATRSLFHVVSKGEPRRNGRGQRAAGPVDAVLAVIGDSRRSQLDKSRPIEQQVDDDARLWRVPAGDEYRAGT